MKTQGEVRNQHPCRHQMPDVLCLAHAFKFDRKYIKGEAHGWRDAGERAKALQDAACSGTDPPIPLALPHAKNIINGRKGADLPHCGSVISCTSRKGGGAHYLSPYTGTDLFVSNKGLEGVSRRYWREAAFETHCYPT